MYTFLLSWWPAGRPAGRVMKLTNLPCLIPRLRMLGVTAPLPYQSSRLHALLSTRTTLPLANDGRFKLIFAQPGQIVTFFFK